MLMDYYFTYHLFNFSSLLLKSSSSNPCSWHMFPSCCQVQISLYPRSKGKTEYRAAVRRKQLLLFQLSEHTSSIAVIIAQQGCRQTQKIHSRLCEVAWKLSNNVFSMLRLHSLVPSGINAIDALEASFLTEVHGRGTTVQVWGCGECLVLETSHVGGVLWLRHWVTWWRSWRKR